MSDPVHVTTKVHC